MGNLFAYVVGILGHTPFWVYILFAYLMWMGLRRLEPRVTPITRVVILPVVFIVWGVSGLANRPFGSETIALLWLAGAVLGGLLGYTTGPKILAVDRSRRLVHLPGSWAPLTRNLLIFGSHYGLNVAAAIVPALSTTLLRWDIAVSGASAGYFIGWGVSLWRHYHKAPELSLAAAS